MKSKKLLSLGLAMSMFVAGCPVSANALDKIDKIQGADKYETAGIIADKQSYTTAILVNADSTMADGLSASGLAGATNAPILLTKKHNIPNATIKRVEKANKVYIIGGESSIDKATENVLKDKGIEIKRLQGSDRIKTSYNVAKEIGAINKVSKVILTNAFKGEPDAMSIASVAVRDKAPIVLTDGKSVPFNTTGIESYAIGGTSSMSDNLVNDTNSIRLGGVDRYDTNKKIVNKFYNGAKEFYIASGTDLVYALVGSTISKNTPIVLVNLGSNKEILKDATKITSIGNMSENIIQEILNPIPKELKNIVGNWLNQDDEDFAWLYVREDNINNIPFDIIKTHNLEIGPGVELEFHFQDKSIRELFVFGDGQLLEYGYNEYTGNYSNPAIYEKIGEPVENNFKYIDIDTNKNVDAQYGWKKINGKWRYFNKDGSEVSNYDLALKKMEKLKGLKKNDLINLGIEDVNENWIMPYHNYYWFAYSGEDNGTDFVYLVNKDNFYTCILNGYGKIEKLENYSNPNF
ncbi:cell wall-binding repeat-containing protein [Clostridioides difficile]|nr:cell wall-binding repeat-containing protein [Clostridioides difficile]